MDMKNTKKNSETWKAKFYPIPANKTKKKDAIAHSLQKWIGLREKNLHEHDLFLNDIEVWDDHDLEVLDIDTSTCALCHHHYTNAYDCRSCPLHKIRGVPCYDTKDNDRKYSPYDVFRDQGDPEPMISLLRKALKKQQDSTKK